MFERRLDTGTKVSRDGMDAGAEQEICGVWKGMTS